MRIGTLVTKVALVAIVVVASAGAAGAAQAAGNHGRAAAPCATVKVKATPGVNTAMNPETIKSTVANCSSATETVKLTQKIKGPFGPDRYGTKSWTLTLTAGQTVVKTRSKPYKCCGSYTVTDHVLSSSRTMLAKSRSSFTFA